LPGAIAGGQDELEYPARSRTGRGGQGRPLGAVREFRCHRHAKDVVAMETENLLLSAAVGIAVLAAASLLLKGLWNSTLPAVLGLNPVNAWQAFKILLIAAMVFGSHRAFVLYERASVPERGVAVADSASTR
jgi:hypothetical protein